MFETAIFKTIAKAIDAIGTYKVFYPNGIVKMGITAGMIWVDFEEQEQEGVTMPRHELESMLEYLERIGVRVLVWEEEDIPEQFTCARCGVVEDWEGSHDGDEWGIDGHVCDNCAWELDNEGEEE